MTALLCVNCRHHVHLVEVDVHHCRRPRAPLIVMDDRITGRMVNAAPDVTSCGYERAAEPDRCGPTARFFEETAPPLEPSQPGTEGESATLPPAPRIFAALIVAALVIIIVAVLALRGWK